jgi:hypothetical protein
LAVLLALAAFLGAADGVAAAPTVPKPSVPKVPEVAKPVQRTIKTDGARQAG